MIFSSFYKIAPTRIFIFDILKALICILIFCFVTWLWLIGTKNQEYFGQGKLNSSFFLIFLVFSFWNFKNRIQIQITAIQHKNTILQNEYMNIYNVLEQSIGTTNIILPFLPQQSPILMYNSNTRYNTNCSQTWISRHNKIRLNIPQPYAIKFPI